MQIPDDKLPELIPDLHNLVDPKVEQRLYEGFKRVYEIIVFKFNEQKKDFDKRLTEIAAVANTSVNNALIGAYSQPLTGSGIVDPVVQPIGSSSYGPQLPNTFLAGPIPSFRQITLADLPAIPSGPATQLNADGTILDVNVILEGEYIKRVGNTLVSAFPIGTTNLGEGTLANVETTLYTVPAGYKTLARILILTNNTGGTLTATIKARNAVAAQIYTNDFPVLAGQTIKLILNLSLDAAFTLTGFTSVAGSIDYTIFGSEEPL